MQSKQVKDLETYHTILESTTFDLFKAQKIADKLKKFVLYGVRRNTIRQGQEPLMFSFVHEIKENKNNIYPRLVQLIPSQTTYYMCFDTFNLFCDVTLNKSYRSNYLYNLTKRKQYIEDLRNIAERCEYPLTSVNIVIDDAHIYCLPAYNASKGDYRQNHRRLVLGLIYSLILGERLPEDRTKMDQIGRGLVKLLEQNYSSPHLNNIIHENLERDEEEIEFNMLGVNEGLKNLARNLESNRQTLKEATKTPPQKNSADYDMEFDDWTPDKLLDDEREFNPISNRVSTIIKDYPSIDQYQPFKKQDFAKTMPSGYPPISSNQQPRRDQNKQARSQSDYPAFHNSPVTLTHTNIQSQQNPGKYPNNLGLTQPKTQDKIPQIPPSQHIYSLYKPFQQPSFGTPIQPKKEEPELPQIPQFTQKSIDVPISVTSPSISTPSPAQIHPNIASKQPSQPAQKLYIPSRPPIQKRLTQNAKKDEINNILTSVHHGFMSYTNLNKTQPKKMESVVSLSKPEDDNPDTHFQFALENYMGQFQLFSKLIKSFLNYYLTSNLGRVASFLLARSCVNRKLRLINALIQGKDLFGLGHRVMSLIDLPKYVERIEKTVYKEDPEQFKLLINFKAITAETYEIMKPFLGEIDEVDKTQDLCFFYLYALSKREPQQDIHHLMLYDALYVLQNKTFEFVYDYKQMPKEWDQDYASTKKDMVELLAFRG